MRRVLRNRAAAVIAMREECEEPAGGEPGRWEGGSEGRLHLQHRQACHQLDGRVLDHQDGGTGPGAMHAREGRRAADCICAAEKPAGIGAHSNPGEDEQALQMCPQMRVRGECRKPQHCKCASPQVNVLGDEPPARFRSSVCSSADCTTPSPSSAGVRRTKALARHESETQRLPFSATS